MRFLLEWWAERSGWLKFGLAAGLYVVTLILWFGFDVFWPWGFVVGTLLAVWGLLSGGD